MCDQPIGSDVPEAAGIPDALQEPGAWKSGLKEQVCRWIDECPGVLAESQGGRSDDAPDLYSFHQELSAVRHFTEKTARRTHETLTGFGGTLERMEAELNSSREESARLRMARAAAIDESALVNKLLDLADRTERLSDRLASPPAPSLFSARRAWSEFLSSFSEGFEGTAARVSEILRSLGIERIPTVGEDFDPQTMTAVSTAPSTNGSDGDVLEELLPGYTRNGTVLRFAEVTVSRGKDA